ncbi:MAG: isopentenyl phosphate kinase [Thermoprotei archaeon]|jgi:isopentenyl phosphate kinase
MNEINASNLVIIKLGGSVITDKSKERSVKKDTLNRLSREIAESHVSTIIVHGGGSFGHPLAKKHKVNSGLKGSTLIGASLTESAMKELNLYVINSLINHGIPAVSISPFSIIITDIEKVWSYFFETINFSLNIGFTPVLYGDVVLDKSNGFSILSGDKIIVELVKYFRPKSVIFCLDVDGIYTSDPKINKNAKLIRELSINDAIEIAKSSNNSKKDVTGGIKGKLESAVEIARIGTDVIFINGNRHNLLQKTLKGTIEIGTLLRGLKS